MVADTSREGSGRAGPIGGLISTYPRRLPRWLPWLGGAVVGLIAGLFVARVGYELWPARAAGMGDWGGAGAAAGAGMLVICGLRWLGKERRRGADLPFATFLPWSLLLIYVLWPTVQPPVAWILLGGASALSLAFSLQAQVPATRLRRWCTLMPVATTAGILLVYLRTVGRTVGAADTFEFQVVAPKLGIAHPTGYPLFILLGKLFSLWPAGQVAWRVNLVSVASAALTCWLLYAIVSRLSGQRVVPALATLSLAFSAVFWSQAVGAEVYALNAAFVSAVLGLVLVGIAQRNRTAADVDRPAHWLLGLAAVYGLSLTHHLTMVLLAPAILTGLWFARPVLRRRGWLLVALCFLAPLLLDLYVPLRWPALHDGQWMSPQGFFDYVTGRQFGGAVQIELWRAGRRWAIVGSVLWQAFGPAGTILAIAGLAWLSARRPALALVTAAAWAVYFAYGLIYNVPDVAVFLLPAHIVMALWIGVAMAAGVRLLRAEAAWTLLALLPLSLLWTNWPLADQSGTGWDLYRWGKYVLSLPLPPDATILADSEKIAPLYYLTQVEGIRPDVRAMVLGWEEDYRRELEQRVAAGKPVYLARYLPGLAGQYRLHAMGPLVGATLQPAPVPAMQVTLPDAGWNDGKIRLLGYDAQPGEGRAAWRITLYWTALAKPELAYHVRLRWVGPNGHVWWDDLGAHPVGGYSPMVAWQAGEVVADYHEIPADPAIPPVPLRLEVGLFEPFQDVGPAAGSSSSPWYPVGTLEQPALPGAAPTAHAWRARFGDELLITAASDLGLLPPGEPATLTLEWARIRPGPDYMLALRWIDATGKEAGAARLAPYGGEYPTSQWGAGEMLTGRLTLPTPTVPGVYSLHAGWQDGAGRMLPARCGWLAATTSDCPVSTLRVEGAARGKGVNFDNQALLLKATMGRPQVPRGAVLEVNLRWQALRPWPADYTAFVHLIGPDGKVHGQMDQWPLEGTLPTTGWMPGRVVDDVYRVQLSGDAPPGKYRVEVGWYLLASLRRLPVLDAAGRPVDDHVIVGSVNVTR